MATSKLQQLSRFSATVPVASSLLSLVVVKREMSCEWRPFVRRFSPCVDRIIVGGAWVAAASGAGADTELEWV